MQGGDENGINQEEQQTFAVNQEYTAPLNDPYDDSLSIQPKRRHPILLILLLTLALVLVISLGWLFISKQTDGQNPSTETEPTTVETVAVDFSIPLPNEEEIDSWVVEPNLPRYINIQSLGMTMTRVESLGLKEQTKQIDDPHDIWNAAWYNKSAKPGADGVGIYSCHTFFSPGGLCDGLGDLPFGTEIEVERGDGAIFSYKIVENITITKEEANSYMATLFELPDVAGVKQAISLITCAGNYDRYSGIASHRTMVRAILK